MKYFCPKIEDLASALVLEPLNTVGMVIQCYFICLRWLSKESIIFTYFQSFFWSTWIEVELELEFRPRVTKSKMLLVGLVKLSQW